MGRIMLDTKFKKIAILSATITFTIFVLSFMIFNIFVLNQYYKYRNQLSTYVNKINKINEVNHSIINGQTIDVNNAKSFLPKAINSLAYLNTDIKNYHTDNKYNDVFINLSNGLSFNTLMYKQLLSIINNPNSSDVNISLKNLIVYKNKCNSFYNKIQSQNNSFRLPKQNDTLLNNTSNYISLLANKKKDDEIVSTQNLEFQNNLQNVLDKFSTIKCNLYYYVECARENKMTYSDVLSKDTKNQNSLNDLIEEFSAINIPEDKISIYNDFKKVLDDYNSYLKSFALSVKKEEKQISNSDDNSDLSDLYKDCNSKLTNMNKDFSSLKDNFNKIINDNSK